MILTIDIGNTNITFGVFDGDKLSFVSRLATERNRTDDQFAVEFLAVFKMHDLEPAEITGAVLSSVVPELTGKIKTAVNKVCGIESVIIAPGVKTGLNILIDNPAELGADLVWRDMKCPHLSLTSAQPQKYMQLMSMAAITAAQ